MDVTGGAHLASVVVVSGGAASGGGGPAPFLLKTYEMVDDPATDEVVSWSASEASFVVWNPQEFSAQLLPTYFKHNNFSSFIRQLNTYGFRKIDLERWEFSNEHFVRGQKHLLKNIHRRKPIHSHSHQPSALPDNERAILEDEIYRLTQEKNALHADLRKFEQHQSGAVTQIEDLERRVLAIEQRQLKMITFLQQASKNPCFVDMLVKIAEASSAFTDTFHKKRRLPGVDYCNEATEISSYDDHSSTSKPEIGNILNQQFYDKLKLGLCSTMTESNFMAASTHSSHEDNGSHHGKHVECEIIRMDCLPLVPQMLEHSDTGTSFGPSRNASFARAIHDEGILPCHLNLTLASCSMEIDRSHISNANGSTADQGPDNPVDTTSAVEKEDDIGRLFCDSHKASGDSGPTVVTTSQQDAEAAGGAPAAPPAVVNDKFWEQFLTERPGCPDTEETSSNIRRDFSREHVDDKKQAHEDTSNDSEYVKQLKL